MRDSGANSFFSEPVFKFPVDKLFILFIMIYIQYILMARSVTTGRAEKVREAGIEYYYIKSI